MKNETIEIPVLPKSNPAVEITNAAASSCCTPKNNASVCCTPSETKEDNGACCAQPEDGSACCNK